MTIKAPPTLEDEEQQQEEKTSGEVLLRDESDEIIDNLKEQLQALQGQLAKFNDKKPPETSKSPESSEIETRLQAGLTPHIASRLQIPAEELSQRLERLMDKVSEPELRDELEKSHDTALFLYDTFKRISEKHEDLTQSLTDESLVMDGGTFVGQLQESMNQHNLPVQVQEKGALPERMLLPPRSVITVLTTLTNLAVDLFGHAAQLQLSCPGLESANPGDTMGLWLRISSDRALPGMDDEEEVTSLAIRSGVRSHAVVDLLYVEKIIEMRGGSLGFHRKAGKTHGFEVMIPVTVLEKDARVETS